MPPDSVRDRAASPEAKVSPGDPEGIGQRLKALRRAQGLTLAQVAERTGISVGTLSQTERGHVSPTVRTIFAVSSALNVAPAWVIDPDSSPALDPDGPYVIRAGRRKLVLEAGGVRKEIASPAGATGYKAFLMTLAPGASSGDAAYTHSGEEIAIVLTGQFRIQIEDAAHDLGPGDTFAFPSSLAHRFSNPGAVEATVFWINSAR
jgi:transcriptional regulator with XRE-family HTH domain